MWMPVVEKDFGQDRFLTDEPSELFRKGNFNKVSVMVGRTTDEFTSFVPGTLSSDYRILLAELMADIANFLQDFWPASESK